MWEGKERGRATGGARRPVGRKSLNQETIHDSHAIAQHPAGHDKRLFRLQRIVSSVKIGRY